MNIAIIGFGSMGQKIKDIAEARGHAVPLIIDPLNPKASHQDISKVDLSGVDVVLDFSSAASVINNLNTVASSGKALVIGTTGWYEHLPEVQKIAVSANIGLLWSANFSIGVNLYYRLVERAAELMNHYDEYDVWGTELHHHNKADSPSGTAKELAKILLGNISRKTAMVYDRLDRKIQNNEIHFSSTRGGAVNFSHTVGFDSPSDTITITHSARDRGGYALGAVKAAEWLIGKKGVFTMNDFLNISWPPPLPA